MENKKKVEEDEEPPELIIHDYDSSISKDEKDYAYQHTGFNMEKSVLER